MNEYGVKFQYIRRQADGVPYRAVIGLGSDGDGTPITIHTYRDCLPAFASAIHPEAQSDIAGSIDRGITMQIQACPGLIELR